MQVDQGTKAVFFNLLLRSSSSNRWKTDGMQHLFLEEVLLNISPENVFFIVLTVTGKVCAQGSWKE